MTKISIVDYGLGNIYSIVSALKFLNIDSELISKPNQFNSASHILLPGVGAFPTAINNLNNLELTDKIKIHASAGKPLLGICLGMQLLFQFSQEIKHTAGLNIIPGNITKIFNPIETNSSIKLPHIGWTKLTNSMSHNSSSDKNLNILLNNNSFYFVHSYRAHCEHKFTLYYANYCGHEIPAVVINGLTIGMQFHPEKSGSHGLALLDYFSKL